MNVFSKLPSQSFSTRRTTIASGLFKNNVYAHLAPTPIYWRTRTAIWKKQFNKKIFYTGSKNTEWSNGLLRILILRPHHWYDNFSKYCHTGLFSPPFYFQHQLLFKTRKMPKGNMSSPSYYIDCLGQIIGHLMYVWPWPWIKLHGSCTRHTASLWCTYVPSYLKIFC